LLISRGVRRDSQLIMFFRSDGKYAVFEGSKIRRILPDEQSLWGVLRKVIKSVKGLGRPNVHWGVRVFESDFRGLLRRAGAKLRFFIFPRGGNLRGLKLINEVSLVIPFFTPYTEEEARCLTEEGYKPIDGLLSKLHPDQVIAYLQLTLDRGVKGLGIT